MPINDELFIVVSNKDHKFIMMFMTKSY